MNRSTTTAERKPKDRAVPDAICGWLATRLRDLQDEGQLLVDDYWRRLIEGRTRHKKYAYGSLGVRLRARDTGAFSIEWYESGVIGGKVVAVKHLNKSRRSHRYTLDQTLKGEPEWVAELVREMEDEFADIRKQQALLVKVRDALVAYEAEITGRAVTSEALIRRGREVAGHAGQAGAGARGDHDDEGERGNGTAGR